MPVFTFLLEAGSLLSDTRIWLQASTLAYNLPQKKESREIGVADLASRSAGPVNLAPSGLNSYPRDLSSRFVAREIRELRDAADRRLRIAHLVSSEIVRRLAAVYATLPPPERPRPDQIAELARLVLSPDSHEAAAYVADLRTRGITEAVLFTELLEPAAKLLGSLWEEDRIDFYDVTLGVGQLQALMSSFNSTHEIATSSQYRSVVMLTIQSEQHSFGIAMVERFLEAGGWEVASHRGASVATVDTLVAHDWFAVAGITVSDEQNLEEAGAIISRIRQHSLNRDIGIMVGGPAFSGQPRLVKGLGADGTANSAPAAVVLAQKLLDTTLAKQDSAGYSHA